jgi:hypothetical protein
MTQPTLGGHTVYWFLLPKTEEAKPRQIEVKVS